MKNSDNKRRNSTKTKDNLQEDLTNDNQNIKDIKNIKNEISDYKNQMYDLQNKKDELTNSLSDVQNDIKNQEKHQKEISNRKEKLQNKIDNLPKDPSIDPDAMSDYLGNDEQKKLDEIVKNSQEKIAEYENQMNDQSRLSSEGMQELVEKNISHNMSEGQKNVIDSKYYDKKKDSLTRDGKVFVKDIYDKMLEGKYQEHGVIKEGTTESLFKDAITNVKTQNEEEVKKRRDNLTKSVEKEKKNLKNKTYNFVKDNLNDQISKLGGEYNKTQGQIDKLKEQEKNIGSQIKEANFDQGITDIEAQLKKAMLRYDILLSKSDKSKENINLFDDDLFSDLDNMKKSRSNSVNVKRDNIDLTIDDRDLEKPDLFEDFDIKKPRSNTLTDKSAKLDLENDFEEDIVDKTTQADSDLSSEAGDFIATPDDLEPDKSRSRDSNAASDIDEIMFGDDKDLEKDNKYVDPITQAMREEVKHNQMSAIFDLINDRLGQDAEKDLDNLSKEQKFNAFSENWNNNPELRDDFSELLNSDPEIKGEFLNKIRDVEANKYAKVHEKFNKSFKDVNWGESTDTDKDDLTIRTNEVKNSKGETLTTLEETSHSSPINVVSSSGESQKIEGYRTIDFPTKTKGTTHLSIVAKKADGRNMDEDDAVYFTAHYNKKGELEEFTHPEPIKFAGEGKDAVAFFEKGGEIHTLPITKGKYEEMQKAKVKDSKDIVIEKEEQKEKPKEAKDVFSTQDDMPIEAQKIKESLSQLVQKDTNKSLDVSGKKNRSASVKYSKDSLEQNSKSRSSTQYGRG